MQRQPLSSHLALAITFENTVSITLENYRPTPRLSSAPELLLTRIYFADKTSFQQATWRLAGNVAVVLISLSQSFGQWLVVRSDVATSMMCVNIQTFACLPACLPAYLKLLAPFHLRQVFTNGTLDVDLHINTLAHTHARARTHARTLTPIYDTKGAVTKKRVVPWSYMMNVCTHSYSLVWYNWDDWQEFIDWMVSFINTRTNSLLSFLNTVSFVKCEC